MPLPKRRNLVADTDSHGESSGPQNTGPVHVRAIRRNFHYMKRDQYKRGKATMLVLGQPHISSQSSPIKGSASNPPSGQEQTKAVVDAALREELGGARILADDLIDHMFGALIPTEFAKRVLEGLLAAGKVQVRDSKGKIPKDATDALENAYQRALAHGCMRDGVETVKTTPKKGKGSAAGPRWKWTWEGYPRSTIVEKDLVDYLNEIVDAALALPCLENLLKEHPPLYRFAVPNDTSHAFPLAYGPHNEDMRPDFIVLPVDGIETLDQETSGSAVKYVADRKYCNFTMIRLSGECKTSNAISGIAQVQRYMRGTKRAQPWQRFVTAMTVTRNTVGFMRGEGSGIERVALELQHGHSSLEFVRLLLGIVLADDETFGKSPHFELSQQKKMLPSALPDSSPDAQQPDVGFGPSNSSHHGDGRRRSSRLMARNSQHGSRPGSYHSHPQRQSKSNSQRSQPNLRSSSHHSPSPSTLDVALPTSSTRTSRSSQKRKHSGDPQHVSRSSQRLKRNSDGGADADEHRDDDGGEHDDEGDDHDDDEYVDPFAKPPATKKIVIKEYVVRVPVKVFGYDCEGMLFNVASIRGRGTVVWVGQNTDRVKVAFKISWQDVSRKETRDRVLENLSSHDTRHDNVLYPKQLIIEEDSTLRTIRTFTASEVEGWSSDNKIEDRVLELHVSDLRRPIRYFWSVQDVVMGLRGALLGHEYLVSIGILHRDVSENNVVLGLTPHGPRGYIMDLDMAVPYKPHGLQPLAAVGPRTRLLGLNRAAHPSTTPMTGPFKAERTGTTPYMSINVLMCKDHTHYDDTESFFYVLLLFFLSYKGPLSSQELQDADGASFAQSTSSTHPRHLTKWPDRFQAWCGEQAAHYKLAFFSQSPTDPDFELYAQETEKRWNDADLLLSIDTLILSCLDLFQRPGLGRRVSHGEFVRVLDQWLQDYPVPVQGYNSCPFTEGGGKQLLRRAI